MTKPPFETFLADALNQYVDYLKNEAATSRRSLGNATIGHRRRGAEEFAMFLMGQRPKTEPRP